MCPCCQGSAFSVVLFTCTKSRSVHLCQACIFLKTIYQVSLSVSVLEREREKGWNQLKVLKFDLETKMQLIIVISCVFISLTAL